MVDVTFIIPIAPYHDAIADRAITSAQVQTVPSTVIYVRDTDGKGPAWARNRALEQAKDGFIVFLDADDWVEPNFVERCLRVWKPGKYVYTDWVKDSGEVVRAYETPWCDNGEWHPITTLLTKGDVNKVGGFDDFPGGEDSEFYWCLTRSVKVCGIALHEPLFHYSKDGRRSKQWLDIQDGHGPLDFSKNQNYIQHTRMLIRRYGNMGCCHGQIIQAGFAVEEGQPGDVLAMAIWGGNKQVRGIISGRLYPRAGNGSQVMVDPRDVQAAPHQWRIVPPPPPPLEKPAFREPEPLPIVKANGFKQVVAALFDMPEPKQTLEDILAVERGPQRPDIAGIMEKAHALYE